MKVGVGKGNEIFLCLGDEVFLILKIEKIVCDLEHTSGRTSSADKEGERLYLERVLLCM